jgi:hypothetical protein
MDPELARIGSLVEDLRASLARLEARVAELEASPGERAAVVAAARAASAPTGEEPAALGEHAVRRTVALIGRGVLVLGGAYVLRALVDVRALPVALGAILALAYAAASLVLADRAARHGAPLSTAFHGATALAVAVPLVDELVVRFQIVGPHVGAALLGAFGAGAGLVAHRRRVTALAWIAVMATVAAGAVLAVQTRLAPVLALLAGVAAAGAWTARRLRARYLVWPAIVVGDLFALIVAQLVLAERSRTGPVAVLVVLLAFFAASMGALQLAAETSIAEVAAAAATLACVLVEGARAAHAAGHGPWFGGAVLAIAAAGWTQARRTRDPWFSAWWVLAALIALAVLADGATLALFDLALAGALLAAARRAPPGATLHAVAALGAAALASGLLAFAWGALAGVPSAPPLAALVVLGAICGAAVLVGDAPPTSPWVERAAAPAAFAFALAGAAGLTAWAAIACAHADLALTATLRTGVLTTGTIVVALASRVARFRAARALVYPLLMATGAKVVLEDLRLGVAVNLFVAFALYGAALMLAPRLRGPANSTDGAVPAARFSQTAPAEPRAADGTVRDGVR